MLKYTVIDDKYKNINQILKQEFKVSSRLLNKLIKLKYVNLNGIPTDTRNEISIGDIITVNLDFEEESENIVATNIPLDIVYEDDSLLVINKPAGIAIHPSILHYEDSLSNGVKYYFEQKGLHKKIRPVNRLDFDTSGLVVFAKNQYVQEYLIQQMKENIFQKEYIAIACGHFENSSGIINAPISRKEGSIIERYVSSDGQQAITEYEVLKNFEIVNESFALVLCKLKTGRTHQIRVHMAYIGHPLLGDTMYGHSSNLINRQALHSYRVSFVHPIIRKNLEITCELPYDMKCTKEDRPL